jgi:hypothetical protein
LTQGLFLCLFACNPFRLFFFFSLSKLFSAVCLLEFPVAHVTQLTTLSFLSLRRACHVGDVDLTFSVNAFVVFARIRRLRENHAGNEKKARREYGRQTVSHIAAPRTSSVSLLSGFF